MSSVLRRFATQLKLALKGSPDRFLGHVSGVVHVGANTGQERKLYRSLGLKVIWIEPIPEVYAALQANLRGYPGQQGVQCLVTDRDGEEYAFHIANNNGASSSILDFNQHKDIWPQVRFANTIQLKSATLVSLLERERIDPVEYQALILDTQGSELLVLKGAIPLLRHFAYIKTEVPDFESYVGCCQLADISAFMAEHGYLEVTRRKFASHPEGGSYFDIVFRRSAGRTRMINGPSLHASGR